MRRCALIHLLCASSLIGVVVLSASEELPRSEDRSAISSSEAPSKPKPGSAVAFSDAMPIRSSANQPTPIFSQTPQPLTERRILQNSALIFSGTVLGVEHLAASSTLSQPITRIRFHVQEGIRGARAGQVIEIREWGGLWNSGERYRSGETVLLFLYPTSKLGLTSPVAGSAGRFRVDAYGTVRLGKEQQSFRPGTVRGSSISVKDFAAAIRQAAGD
jgi:hypothetical protein